MLAEVCVITTSHPLSLTTPSLYHTTLSLSSPSITHHSLFSLPTSCFNSRTCWLRCVSLLPHTLSLTHHPLSHITPSSHYPLPISTQGHAGRGVCCYYLTPPSLIHPLYHTTLSHTPSLSHTTLYHTSLHLLITFSHNTVSLTHHPLSHTPPSLTHHSLFSLPTSYYNSRTCWLRCVSLLPHTLSLTQHPLSHTTPSITHHPLPLPLSLISPPNPFSLFLFL